MEFYKILFLQETNSSYGLPKGAITVKMTLYKKKTKKTRKQWFAHVMVMPIS